MSHTPPLDPLGSLRLSPSLGYERDSSRSGSSSSTVRAVTGPHLRRDMLSGQGNTSKKRRQVIYHDRNKVPHQRKVRSKLSRLATPFRVDVRPRSQGISHLAMGRLPTRILKGKYKRQRVRNVNKVGKKV